LDRQGDDALRLRPMLKLARVLRRMGLLDRAEELGGQALALARERHDREAVVDGLLTLSSLAWSRGDLDRCEALTQEGLVLASGPQSGRARAALLLSLTSVQANRGQLASAAAGLTDAVAVLKDLRDKGLRAVALVNLAEVLLGQGEIPAAWERSEEALGLAREMGHRLVEAAVHRVRGMLLAQVGLQAQAEKELAVAVGMGQVLAVPQELCSAAFHLSRALLEQGKLEDAARHLDTAATAVASGDPERYRIAVDVERALIHALAGRYAEGRALLEAAIPQAPLLPALRRSEVTLDIARCWAALGEVGLALSTVRTALQLASVRGFRLLVLEALAFGAWFSSDPGEKERMSQQLGESLVALALPPTWSASLRQRLGLA
jgi:tetratricopeptide (TPR) repeat protein